MARRILSKVYDGVLHLQNAEGLPLDPIEIGTGGWFSWLEQHHSFSFQAAHMTFTARKEQRPGCHYWYGYQI